MGGPWEAYQQPAPSGPWDAYKKTGPSVEIVSVNGEPETLSPMDQVKSGARSVVEGAASLPMAVGDAVNTLANYGILGINKLSGSDIPTLNLPSETLRQMLNATGAKEDTGISGDVIRGASGAMTFPAAAMTTPAASTMGAALKSSLAAKPVLQVASGATGGAGSGFVREMGGGPVAQLVGGVVGSMAPVAAGQIPSAARSVIAGKRGAQGAAENIRTFQDAGTFPTVGQATQSRAAQAAESFLSRSPGSAGVVAEKATAQGDDIARMIEEIAGRSGGKAQTGKAIKEGVTDFTAQFKEKAGQLYDLVDGVIPPNQQVPVNNTISTLRNLTSKIKGAARTSEEFINPKLARIKQNIVQDTGETIRARRDSVKNTIQEINTVQSKIDDLERNIVDQAAAEEVYAQRLGGKMTTGPRDSLVINELNATKKELEKRLSADLPKMLKDDMAELAKGRQMPYRSMKELRTRIGYMLDSSELVSDIPKSELKKVYGAISRDIEAGLPPDATQFLGRANQFYKAGRDRIDTLENILSGKTYEKIYNAAIGETKDGPTLINKVLRSMPTQTRSKMAHEFLRTMGKATAGNQGAAGDVFSTETFLTNWNKMDPRAKSALFANIDPQYTKAIDSISQVAENIRTGSKVFRNTSGTQQAVSLEQTIGGALVLLLTGNVVPAIATATEPAIAYGAAKWMTNPNIVKWIAQNSRRPVESLPILVNSLAQRHQNDPEVQEFAETFSTEPPKQKTQPVSIQIPKTNELAPSHTQNALAQQGAPYGR